MRGYKIINNGYLTCEKCSGYYALQDNESPVDFDSCQCGGKLKYQARIDITSTKNSSEKIYVRKRMSIGKTYTEKKAEEHSSFDKTEYTKFSRFIEENEFLYHKSPKIHDPHYVIIGLIILITGMIFFSISVLSLVLISIGVLFTGYGLYKPHYKFKSPLANRLVKKVYTAEGKLWVKGLVGENIVLDCLDTLPKDYFVLHDVMLPEGYGNIDDIVVGPTGLFVIETKNYNGQYKINGNYWYYLRDGKYCKYDKNPGKQLSRNIISLKKFLESNGIKKTAVYAEGIVAFVQNNFDLKKQPINYKVFAPEMIPNYILNRPKKRNLKVLAKVVEELEPYSTSLTFVAEK